MKILHLPRVDAVCRALTTSLRRCIQPDPITIRRERGDVGNAAEPRIRSGFAESSPATAREAGIPIVFIPRIQQATEGFSNLECAAARLRARLDEVQHAVIAGPDLECRAAGGRDSARERAE